MKNVFSILILLVLVSCSSKTDKKNNSIIGMESSNRNFKDIPQLKNYVKVSDTSIYKSNAADKYGILHLKNEANHLVIFKGIITDSINKVSYKILDTLSISNLKKPQFITIGYCNIKSDNKANIIAIVDKTDSLKIKNIKKVWMANTTSEKIELENNLNGIDCFNEFFTK
ncbi:hypothetical protein [Polaribacter sp. 20A6]|uniref:hypothetical protein n=1 Tax=Polaribacter sp. 20A6 TaxID=2687289 RepID=UPI0013FD8C2D|nr:hypothetical protein [Polaribacter sp. 20A6]